MFCHGAGEAAVHPGCGVYARAYGGNHGSFFFQGNGLRRREHRLFFNALPKECRSKDRAKGAHGQRLLIRFRALAPGGGKAAIARRKGSPAIADALIDGVFSGG